MRVPHKIPGDRRVKDSADTVVTERSVLQINGATVSTTGVTTDPVTVAVAGGGDALEPITPSQYYSSMVSVSDASVLIDSTPDAGLDLTSATLDWDGTDFLTGLTDLPSGEFFFNTRGLYEVSFIFWTSSVWPTTERFSIYALASKAGPGSANASGQFVSGGSFEKGHGASASFVNFSFTDYYEEDDGFVLRQWGADNIAGTINLTCEAYIQKII